MTPDYEQKIRIALEGDEALRDRATYVYTTDALRQSFFSPDQVWPEPNHTTVAVVAGTTDYNKLPFDEDNEIAKGTAFPAQQHIIQSNAGKPVLCEATGYQQCKKEECVLYNAALNPPVCREFKIAFMKS